MIPLDPEEVFGLALWEALKRAFGFLGCLLLGSFLAFCSAFAAQTIISFTPLAGGYFLPAFSAYGLLMLPLWVMTSVFAIAAIPNAFVAIFYYIRCEEPAANRFLVFTIIQQICLTGAFNEWAYEPGFAAESIASSVILWFFSIGFIALLFFAKIFWKNKERCGHEEHLMSVAAENEAWKRSLEEKEFIPPPPSGPKAPKARPLD
jgi:hypothetical protein